MQASDDMRQGRKSNLFILTSTLIVAISGGLMLSVALESYFIASEPLPKADAIVVMVGGRDVRLPPVAELYAKGVAPLVLLTNDGIFASWSQKYQRNLYLVEWAREDLLEMEVPKDARVLTIIQPSKSSIWFSAAVGRLRTRFEW